MKLEAGKFYRTRYGSKRFVAAASNPMTNDPFYQVLVLTKTFPYSTNLEGRMYAETELPDDLIAPWIDPPWDYTPSPGEWVFACDPTGHRCAVAFPMQEQIDDAREAGYCFAKMDQPPPPPGE